MEIKDVKTVRLQLEKVVKCEGMDKDLLADLQHVVTKGINKLRSDFVELGDSKWKRGAGWSEYGEHILITLYQGDGEYQCTPRELEGVFNQLVDVMEDYAIKYTVTVEGRG
jgi:hypothetical protein